MDSLVNYPWLQLDRLNLTPVVLETYYSIHLNYQRFFDIRPVFGGW